MSSASVEKLRTLFTKLSQTRRTQEIYVHLSISLTLFEKIEKKKKKKLFQNFSVAGEGDYFNSNKTHSRVNDSLLKEGGTRKMKNLLDSGLENKRVRVHR
ncbi:hypothetical protein CEXT_148751 [Caerostris extrusa]|uniref:Uncharacterized protein n=1 Tax=Caerostris extrusa TaxID=172846 RepID=A0AAV4R2J3_CAEEX|nr:hypothetical protein CEXT_148751 [Caerostris extrusa]